MNKRILLIASLIACCIVWACSSQNHTSSQPTASHDSFPEPKDKLVKDITGQKGGKLVLSLSGNLDTFNILLTNTVDTQSTLGGYVFQGLVELDPLTMKDIPLLAKEFKISPDGLTYTYTLREGVYWADGTPFTMDDVIFSFELVYDPSLAIGEREMLQNPDGTMPVITRLNDTQIQFKINDINVLFNGAVGSVKILPKHLWGEAHKAGQFAQVMRLNEDPKKIVGTGPFMLDSYTPDQRIVLKRNPYYYEYDKNGERLPYLDKVIRVIVPDLQAVLMRFQNGETDMIEINKPEDVDLLKRDEEKGRYKVYNVGPSYNTTYLMLNQNTRQNSQGKPFVEAKKLKLFSDKRFKQALSYAINRQDIVRTIYYNMATPIYSFTSPANTTWYNPDQKPYPFDLEKAKTLLAEIGLKDSNQDGTLEYEDGSPLTFTLKTNAENNMRIQSANMIKSDFVKLGIDVNLAVIPFNSIIENMSSNYDFDAVLMGWGTSVPPDPVMSKSTILSSGNNHNWNPKQASPQTEWEKNMNDLMHKNQSHIDVNERQKAWFEILKIWGEELPQIMILSPNVNVAVRNHLGNVKPISLRPYFDYNMSEIYIKGAP